MLAPRFEARGRGQVYPCFGLHLERQGCLQRSKGRSLDRARVPWMQLLQREVDHVELINNSLQTDELVRDELVYQLSTLFNLAQFGFECFVRFLFLTVLSTRGASGSLSLLGSTQPSTSLS